MGAHNNDPVAHVHKIFEYYNTIEVVKKLVPNSPDTIMLSSSDMRQVVLLWVSNLTLIPTPIIVKTRGH